MHRHAAGQAAPAGELMWERLYRETERARRILDCREHGFRIQREGNIECEDCHHELLRYILRCRFCGLQRCARCARNRLQ